MQIKKGTILPRMYITWPHQVSIGKNCILEQDIYFKFDGIHKPGPSIKIGDNVFIGATVEFNIRKGIVIGNDCLIASGCRFIDHDHDTKRDALMRQQTGPEKEILIANNVWIGCNVVVLKGVCIGEGAVVAAGSVVTKNIESYTISAGVPARFIKNI